MDNRRSDNNKNKLLYDPDQAYLRRLGAFSNAQNYDEDEIDDDVNDEELENNDFEEKNDIADSSSPSSSALDDTKESEKGQTKSAASNLAKQVGKQVAAKGKAVASALGKKLIAFIAANPWVLAILAGVIVIFIILLAIAGGSDSGSKKGLSGYKYFEVDNVCDKVTVYNHEKDKQTGWIDFETEYIPTVLAVEVGGLNNEEFLNAMAISIRNYALQRLNDDCSIEGSTYSQAFEFDDTKRTGYTAEGSDYRKAAEDTYGLILVKDNSLKSVYYDAACYALDEDTDNAYTINYGSVTLGETNKQLIPKSWANENNIMTYINKSIKENKSCYENHGMGLTQWGAFYLATQENYSMYELFEYYYGEVEIYSMYPTGTLNYNYDTSYGQEGYLDTSLKEFLEGKNITIESLNEHILENVLDAGVGTRNAAVAAAVSLVGDLWNTYQRKLPYTFCGQHASCMNMYHNGENVNRSATSFYGVDPNWGTKISSNINDPDGLYYYVSEKHTSSHVSYGPDCSGFVTWVLHNAGFDLPVYDSEGFAALGEKHYIANEFRGQPGDLLWYEGHIMFIVGVTDEGYRIAHASGEGYGVKINLVDYYGTYTKDYYVIDMSDWYKKNAPSYTDEEFTEIYRAGYVDGYTGDSAVFPNDVSRDMYLVGDSRTVGVCQIALSCSGDSCNTDTCLAKVSMGFDWFSNKISVIAGTRKDNIVINMGVNDLPGASTDSAKEIANKYYDLIKNKIAGRYTGTIYYMSINPVSDNASVSKEAIIAFNEQMQNRISSDGDRYNIKYLDAYNNLNFNITDDGLHYLGDTYKAIYEYIRNEVLE